MLIIAGIFFSHRRRANTGGKCVQNELRIAQKLGFLCIPLVGLDMRKKDPFFFNKSLWNRRESLHDIQK